MCIRDRLCSADSRTHRQQHLLPARGPRTCPPWRPRPPPGLQLPAVRPKWRLLKKMRWWLWWNHFPWGLGCTPTPVSYTHLRAHETKAKLVCRRMLEKKKKKKKKKKKHKQNKQKKYKKKKKKKKQ